MDLQTILTGTEISAEETEPIVLEEDENWCESTESSHSSKSYNHRSFGMAYRFLKISFQRRKINLSQYSEFCRPNRRHNQQRN